MARRHARLKLLVSIILMAWIWLVLLPYVSRYEPIRAMIDSNEAAGIDPSAMFYSELEHLSYQNGMLRRESVASGLQLTGNAPGNR